MKKIHQEKKLEMLVDKDLKNNYDRIELEEMVQVALLCTQYLPLHRPKMSEVVRMLEGDGLAEKWAASQRAEATSSRPNEFSSSERYSDLTDDSSLLVQAMELSGPRWHDASCKDINKCDNVEKKQKNSGRIWEQECTKMSLLYGSNIRKIPSFVSNIWLYRFELRKLTFECNMFSFYWGIFLRCFTATRCNNTALLEIKFVRSLNFIDKKLIHMIRMLVDVPLKWLYFPLKNNSFYASTIQ